MTITNRNKHNSFKMGIWPHHKHKTSIHELDFRFPNNSQNHPFCCCAHNEAVLWRNYGMLMESDCLHRGWANHCICGRSMVSLFRGASMVGSCSNEYVFDYVWASPHGSRCHLGDRTCKAFSVAHPVHQNLSNFTPLDLLIALVDVKIFQRSRQFLEIEKFIWIHLFYFVCILWFSGTSGQRVVLIWHVNECSVFFGWFDCCVNAVVFVLGMSLFEIDVANGL